MKNRILSFCGAMIFILAAVILLSGISFFCADDTILPDTYTKLEYVESDGAQYFDTDVYVNMQTKVEIDFELTVKTENVSAICGCMDAPFTILSVGTDKIQNNCGKGYYPNFHASYYQKRVTYVLDIPNRTASCGDSSNSLDGAVSINTGLQNSLYLLARSNNDGSATSYATGKLYGARIYQSGELIRDYIPCKTTDYTYGLYDTVSGEFIRASGSDVFVNKANLNIKYEGSFTDGKDNSVVSVSLTTANGSKMLLLPAFTDYGSMLFSGLESGTVLSGTNGKKITYTVGQPLDLTEIFGEMNASQEYKILVTLPGSEEVSTRFSVYKSASVSSIFVTITEGVVGGRTTSSVSLNDIHSSKDNYASNGTVTKVDAEGSCDVIAQLKKLGGRGNTSWYTSIKRPYNLNLKTKEEMIDGVKEGKKWALISNNVSDETGLANMSAQMLYQMLDGDGAAHFEPVDLYIDGVYRGSYMLIQRITDGLCGIESATDIDTDKVSTFTHTVVRSGGIPAATAPKDWPNIAGTSNTDAEKELIDYGIQAFKYSRKSTNKQDGGYIVEYDFRFTDSACWFITRRGIQVALKTPEYPSLEQIKVIAKRIQDLEDALYSQTGYNSYGEHYSEIIDLDSLAKRFLVDCFTLQVDMMSSSSYMYIDGDENGLIGKIITGPAWDYDAQDLEGPNATYLYKYSTWRNRGCRIWIEQFLTKGDFVAILREKNKQLIEIVRMMANGDENEYGSLNYFDALICDSLKMNNLSWAASISTLSYKADYKKRVESWIKLWSDETNNLRGVTVSQSDNTLIADAVGAQKYQWYKVNDKKTLLITIKGADKAEYTPTEEGLYVVKITGNPLGKTADNADAGSMMYSRAYSFTFNTSVSFGDINDDGNIKGNDVTLLLKYLAGWDVKINTQAADVNGDGKVKGNDVTLLLKYLAGWDVKLGK